MDLPTGMDGIRRTLVLCLSACIMIVMILAPVAAADSVTRGGIFTVTIAGKPVTAYYVWFTGTSSMSGKPGDQPPVIIADTENVVFDPDGGPYTIGSYKFYNGGGETILEDVAPSSDTVSNTRYYAQVTTDSDGFGIVEFQTSSATADRTFRIKAENPASPGDDVPVRLGLPARTITVIETVVPSPPETVVTLPVVATILPVTTVPTQPQTTVTTPVKTQLPTTSPATPVATGVVILAAAAGLVVMRKRH